MDIFTNNFGIIFTMIEDFGNRNNDQWKKYGYLIVSIFVLIVATLLIKNSFDKRNSASNSQNIVTNIVVPTIVRANPKEVVKGFPETLILNSKTEIVGSYSATYPGSSAAQFTVEFISSKNPEVNYNFYTKWATDNGWQIINSSQDDFISSLYLKKTVEAINITIRPSVKTTEGSSIVISYVDLNR